MWKSIIKSVFLTKKPVHLILYVTGKCNLRCKTCFVDFDKNRAELTFSEIETISGYLNGLIWLDISGGEPFLREDLDDICMKFDTKSISIPTNGFNPKLIYETTKKIRDRTNCAVTIAVSIDGFEKTNDDIKERGCFIKSIKTLELLKAIKGIKIKVNTVLCEKNYDEIIDFMHYIKQYNIDFHSIIFLRGIPTDPTFKLPSYEKLLRIKKEIFNIWDSYNFGFAGIEGKILKNYLKSMYSSSLRIMMEKKQILECKTGKYHLVIYPNGDISFCEMLNPFGNLRKENIGTLLTTTDAEMQRKFIREKSCYCYHNCNMIDNYFLNPLQYPRLLKNVWK